MKNDIGYLIKQIDVCLQKRANQELLSVDLTFSQLRILILLRDREGKRLLTSHSDIEENLTIAHSTVIGLIRRLEAKGFVRTETSSEDRRIRNIFLANAEQLQWESIIANKDRAERTILKGFSKENIESLRIFLKKILANIK
jgi:DNA-binding MarR family transcriptional regulator